MVTRVDPGARLREARSHADNYGEMGRKNIYVFLGLEILLKFVFQDYFQGYFSVCMLRRKRSDRNLSRLRFSDICSRA